MSATRTTLEVKRQRWTGKNRVLHDGVEGSFHCPTRMCQGQVRKQEAGRSASSIGRIPVDGRIHFRIS